MGQQSPSLGTESTTHPDSEKTEAFSDDQLTRRYVLALEDLVDDAIKRGKHRLLVDALAWHLARFIAHHGAVAAGYILEKIGAHTAYINERQQAQAEANKAREQGVKPN